jgi:2-polyprenyl-3-methyl-5-hydroxy-6-metoxy-1,4-benzoquinol methylase
VDLKESEILGATVEDHWYYQAKQVALLRTVADLDATTAIDIGAGSGYFARRLLAASTVTAIDCVDTSYPASSHERADDGTGIRFLPDLASARRDVDLVLLMDVLEHVDDDHHLLVEATDRLAEHGRVVITVPAYQFLWSGHDEFLEHRRRYNLGQTERLVTSAGLCIERAHYVYGLVFPAAAAQRLADRASRRLRRGEGSAESKLVAHHPVVNRALAAICAAEAPWQRFNRVAGLSVLIRARRC